MIDVEKMAVEQLKAAAKECDALKSQKKKGAKFCGVILTSGFVYVGWVKRFKTHITITSAQNVRYWAKDGLGPSLLSGPPSGSKVDKCGDIRAEKSALHHFVDANPEKWGA